MITIAIDFGTSTTRVAREKAGDWPELLGIGRSAKCMPTTVVLTDDGSLLFGEEADEVALVDPRNYLTDFLHLLGSSQPVLGQYNAAAIVTSYLTCLHNVVKALPAMQGCTIGRTVLTCPLCFTPEQRNDLLRAAENAGFPDVVLISAPEAAAAAYCRRVPEKAFSHTALVVGWGGGSAEVACVTRCDNGDITLLRGYGCAERGGNKVDAAIRSLVLAKLHEDKEIEPAEIAMFPPVAVRRAVREVKQSFSVKGAQDSLFSCLSSGYMYTSLVRRDEYVELLKNEVTSVVDSLKELYRTTAGTHSPEMVLLTGGMVMCDYVAEQFVTAIPLSQNSGYLKTRSWAKSPESIVMGAVILGQYRNPGSGVEVPPPSSDVRVSDLCQAARQGDVAELAAALVAGADVNRPDDSGTTPLAYAVLYGHADCVRTLLHYGAQVDPVDGKGYTPLHLALRAPHLACLELLIDAGAAVNRPTPNGWSPLGYAALRNHADCVSSLLQAPGICPNEPNVYGETALHVAEKYGHEACARLLREKSVG